MSRSKERPSKAALWFLIALGFTGLGATRCGGSTSEDPAENARQQLLALWVEMPHPSPACVNDSASTPLSTDGTVQAFVTGPRERFFRFVPGVNGAQVVVTNVGACDLGTTFFHCDSAGFLDGSYASVTCSPPGSTISGAGASQTCTILLPGLRVVPSLGGSPQGCGFNVKINQL